MQAIVDEAHNFGLAVAAHAHGKQAILRAVRSGIDTLEHGTFLDEDCIGEMLKRGTTYVPTLSIMHDAIARGPQIGHSMPTIDKYKRLQELRTTAVLKAYEAGVQVALGTDSCGWIAEHGHNGVEFKLLTEAGLPPMSAILAGTSTAARALGLSEQLGTVEPGKIADLVVVAENPLQNIASLGVPSNIKVVLRNGQPMPAPWKVVDM